MEAPTNRVGPRWQPGIWKQIPWAAFASLAAFIACCGGLAAVLSTSDGKEVEKWPSEGRRIPVSVLLALLVGIANFCLTIALGRGYEISWWAQALRGAPLRKLHFDLDVQRRLYALITRPMVFDKFALAAVLSLAVSIIDGPLIQQASTIVPRQYGPFAVEDAVHVTNAPLPPDFSYGPTVLTPLFSNISRAYASREDIRIPGMEACTTNTTCNFTLPAPGFDVSCTDELLPYNFDLLAGAGVDDQTLPWPVTSPSHVVYNQSAQAPYKQITTFYVGLDFGKQLPSAKDDRNATYGHINTTFIYKEKNECAGQMSKRRCFLKLATVGYPITVANGVATLGSWQLGQNETIGFPKDPYTATGFNGYSGKYWSMLGGIHFVANALFASQVAFYLPAKEGILFNGTGQAGSTYLTSEVSSTMNCNMTWKDPTVDTISTIRELMFRSAVGYSAANQQTIASQRLTVNMSKVANAYQSHYSFLGIVLGLMILQALVIAVLLCEWRHLGFEMTLDPFEIARSLGAPLFQHGNPMEEIEKTLKPLHHERLRYGETSVEPHEALMGERVPKSPIDDNAIIVATSPEEAVDLYNQHAGAYFDSQGGNTVRPRLRLDREDHVGAIRAGMTY